ncbi:hypothetical protein DQ04_04571050 [Trypanosoma grayi]|uniref:hypothetical protein n=1 Tax=Trypanosoma grayi TaxID=71804 RepID=UPI0004F4371A|nr:hypothetical protein DQ04_04571050 [Trypanosoma grayi]KEG09829.1 hypothetical protein DQ04_04571050 [Trypanosoma grayi]
MPWLMFVPTFIAFFLLNYLACCTTVNADGTDLVMPPNIAATEAERAASYRTQPDEYSFNAQLFLEDTVMRRLFRMCRGIGGMSTIRTVCSLAWLVHCMEIGIAFRICVSCNAAPHVFFFYVLITALGGVTQLAPLVNARDEYVSMQETSTKSTNTVKKKK